MKKLILLFLLITGSLQAQNTISVLYYPTDKGIGLKYDRQVHNSGLYIAMSKGNYRISETESIKTHIKTGFGYVRYLKNEDLTSSYISIGPSYHYYSNQLMPERAYYPISFDLGTGVKFEHTMIGFCFDFLKWEGGINFGINFN